MNKGLKVLLWIIVTIVVVVLVGIVVVVSLIATKSVKEFDIHSEKTEGGDSGTTSGNSKKGALELGLEFAKSDSGKTSILDKMRDFFGIK